MSILIEIDRLVPDPDNVRKWDADEAANNQLIASIEAVGVVQPIIVRQHPDQPEMYMVVAGHRRLAAARAAGLSHVPCDPVPEQLNGNLTAMQLAENVVRLPMREVDVWQAFARLIEQGWTAENAGAAFNISPRRVRQFERMSQLPEPIIDHIRQHNDIPAEHYLRQLVLADPAMLTAAWKSAMGEKGSFTSAPWWDLVRAVQVKRIDLSRALFKLTDEVLVEVDHHHDWFDPADHPGYAHNTGAFWNKQMAEVNAKLNDAVKQGFKSMTLRDMTYDERAKALKPYAILGFEVEKLMKKVKKADREDHVLVATIEPTGGVTFALAERRPEAPKLDTKASEPAEDSGELVTKAMTVLICDSQRNAIADRMASDGWLGEMTLLALATQLLAVRTGYHATPAMLFEADGRITDCPIRIGDAARFVIGKAVLGEITPMREVHRAGAYLDTVATLAVTADGLSALKREALEALFKTRTGDGLPPKGTMKEHRKNLVETFGDNGVLVLTPADLSLLGWAVSPVDAVPPHDPETGEIEDDPANDNEEVDAAA